MFKINKKGAVQLTLPIIIIMVLILAFVFGFFKGDFLNIGLPIQEETTTYNDVVINLKSPYFGETSNTKDLNFCGSNDIDININNFYKEEDNKFIISSSTSSSNSKCVGNGIRAEMTFPAGKLKASCFSNAVDNRDYKSYASCSIDPVVSSSITSFGSPPNFGQSGGDRERFNEKEIIFEKETKVIVEIKGDVSISTNGGGFAKSEAILEFTPLDTPEEIENEKEKVEEKEKIEEKEAEKQEGTGEGVSSDDGFLDKIFNWFSNLFDNIVGWFKS